MGRGCFFSETSESEGYFSFFFLQPLMPFWTIIDTVYVWIFFWWTNSSDDHHEHEDETTSCYVSRAVGHIPSPSIATAPDIHFPCQLIPAQWFPPFWLISASVRPADQLLVRNSIIINASIVAQRTGAARRWLGMAGSS